MSSRRRAAPEVDPHAVTPCLTEAVSAVYPFPYVKEETVDEVDAIIYEDIDMKFKMPGRANKMPSMKILSMEVNSGLWLKNVDWLVNRTFVLYGGNVYVTAADEMSPIAKISDGINTYNANKVSVVVTSDNGRTIDTMIHFFDASGTNLCTCKMHSDPPEAHLYVMTVMGMPATVATLNYALDASAKWMAFAVFSAKFYDDERFDLRDASLDMKMSVRESVRSSMRTSIPDSNRGSYRM